MKLKRVNLLLILMLLSYSISWSQNRNDSPLYGQDSIAIPINIIRAANTKLIERKHIIRINEQQDSIINMKDDYINKQKDIIIDFQNRVNNVNRLNQQINNDLIKSKRKHKVIEYSAASVIVGCIIGLILK